MDGCRWVGVTSAVSLLLVWTGAVITIRKCFIVRSKASLCKCNKIGARRQWLAESSGVEGLSSETQALNQWDTAKAEGQKPGAQQVPQGGQVGDGEVVWVQTPSPHHTDDKVGDIKEDGHLEGEENWAEKGLSMMKHHKQSVFKHIYQNIHNNHSKSTGGLIVSSSLSSLTESSLSCRFP